MMVILLLFALLLSACGGSIETDLTLYSGDRFDATSRVTVPAAGLALVGGADAIESQFKQMEQQASTEGARFSWRKENSRSPDEIVYRISVGGTSYENLATSYGINIQKTQYQGQDALSISASPNYDLSGVQNTVRLHVGKILQSDNWLQIDNSDNWRSGGRNNTIVWSGTEPLQAIITPASSTNWLVILLVVLAIAVAAVVAFLLLRRHPPSQIATPAIAAPVIRAGGFCPHCGQPTQPGARFCMSCGQAIPPRQG